MCGFGPRAIWGVTPALSACRRHCRLLVELRTKALQRDLLEHIRGPLDPVRYLFREALRLPDNPARRVEQSAVALL